MEFNSESFTQIMDQMHEGLYIVDRDRNISYWNKAAENISGFSSEEIRGRSCRDNILTHVLADGTNLCTGLCPLAKTMVDGKSAEAEVYLHHKDGHRVPVLVRVNPLHDEDGRLVGGVELFTDLSSKSAIELKMSELEKMALLDKLTNIPNRNYIDQELEERFRELKEHSVSFGLLFFDIDHFKNFNDTYGHSTGDRVLQYVAKTLQTNARPFDSFARWGGEEFVGIIRNVDADQLVMVAERFRNLVEQSYILHDELKLNVTVSIGCSLARSDEQVPELLERTDSLMYSSKQAGRNRVSSDHIRG